MKTCADIEIRVLRLGDESVIRVLQTYDGDGDPEGLLADPHTLMLAAFDDERPLGFVLAHDWGTDVVWKFAYTDN